MVSLFIGARAEAALSLKGEMLDPYRQQGRKLIVKRATSWCDLSMRS